MGAWSEAVYVIKQMETLLGLKQTADTLNKRRYIVDITKDGVRPASSSGPYAEGALWFVKSGKESTGLYNPNGAFISWPTLVSQGSIQVQDNTIVKVNKDIAVGKIVVPETFKNIAEEAFMGCNQLTELELPEITTVGARAFKGCTSLERLSILNFTSIGDEAFSGCTLLENIILDSISNQNVQIGESILENCISLSGANIFTESVTKLPNGTFRNCPLLISFTIPDSVTEIGATAFADCSSLSIEINERVTTIGEDAFRDVAHIYYAGDATGSPWGAKEIN